MNIAIHRQAMSRPDVQDVLVSQKKKTNVKHHLIRATRGENSKKQANTDAMIPRSVRIVSAL